MAKFEPRSDITAMPKYHSPQVDVPVRLNTNESPFAPPRQWLDGLGSIVSGIDWNRYPDRLARRLRDAIALRHRVTPDNVFVANGSNEVLQTLLLTYAGPGRTVATFEPTYQLHSHIARITGSTVVSGRRNADFSLDESEIRRVVADHRPHVLFLCSPNNPTGVVEQRRNVDFAINETPGLVIIDEAYAEFADWSAMELVSEDGNVVVSRTFSKTWSLAALRLGYVIAPKTVVAQLEAVVLPYHLDAFKQAAGLSALSFVDEMDDRVRAIVAERGRINEALDAMAVQRWESGANFVLFRPTVADAEGVWTDLVDKGVLVRDCSSWPGLEGCLRVTVGTRDENEKFIEALKSIVGTRE